MMAFGVFCLFSPFIEVFSWIPLVGKLLGGVVAFAALIIAVVFSLTFGTLTIALAWLYYRPIYGICLLSASFVGLHMIFIDDFGLLA